MKETLDPRITVLSERELGTRPSWDEYFMSIAIDVSTRASCYKVHAGAVIVNEAHQILGTGYNGAAPGLGSCLDFGSCKKEASTGKDYGEYHGTGKCWGTHAEMNARGHITRDMESSFTLYNTIFPCNDCAKGLLTYPAFKRIVFKSVYDEADMKNPLEMFHKREVEICRLDLSPERKLDLEFNERPAKFAVWSPQDRERIANFLKAIKNEI